jgi:hypothetical protein
MFADDQRDFAKFKAPAKPVFALVSSLDSMFLLRRNLAALLTPETARRTVAGEKGPRELGSLSDLTSNAILDRGAIIGLWEYDPETTSLVWFTFSKPDKSLRACIEQTEAYVRDQLGDARSFSLDSPKSRLPRIQAIRKAQPQ